MNTRKVISLFACCGLLAGPLSGAGEEAPVKISGADKVRMAKAAEAECYELLLSQIKGLKVTEKMTVADAVTQGFEQTAAVSGIVQGAQLKEPVYQEDVCLMNAEITIEQIVENLSRSIKTVNDTQKAYFEAIKRYNTNTVISVTGKGTLAAPEEVAKTPAKSRDTGEVATLKRLKGPGQYKVMAMKAALLDAYAQLAAYLKGIRVSTSMTVKDCVASSWTEAETEAIIKGAYVVRYAALASDLVQCWVEINLETVVENVHEHSTLFANGKEVTVVNIKRFNGDDLTVTATGRGAVVRPGSSTSNAGTKKRTGIAGSVQ